jgi:uncharacterized protein
MQRISRRVADRPIATFGVLAYALSWILWLPAMLHEGEATPPISLLIIAGGFGPLVGAALVTRITKGKVGLRSWAGRIVQFRAPWYTYLFALGWPIAAAVVVWLLNRLAGGSLPADWVAPPLLAYPLAWTFVLLVGGGQEEPGWRGLALPLLLERHSPLVASVLVGALWGFWHLPLFAIPSAPQTQIPLGIYLPHVVIVSIIFTWLHLNARSSVWLAMVLHAGLNAVTSWVPISGETTTLLLLLLAVEALTAAGLVVLHGARRFASCPSKAANAMTLTRSVP